MPCLHSSIFWSKSRSLAFRPFLAIGFSVMSILIRMATVAYLAALDSASIGMDIPPLGHLGALGER
jgi:hypothetical protein